MNNYNVDYCTFEDICLIKNSKEDLDLLYKFSNNKNVAIKNAVAESDKCPIDILLKMLIEAKQNVIIKINYNNIPDNFKLIKSIIKNKNFILNKFDELFDDLYFQKNIIFEMLANDIDCPYSVLKFIYKKDIELNVLNKIENHPNWKLKDFQ